MIMVSGADMTPWGTRHVAIVADAAAGGSHRKKRWQEKKADATRQAIKSETERDERHNYEVP